MRVSEIRVNQIRVNQGLSEVKGIHFRDAPIEREQNLILQEFGCNQIVSD